MTERKDYSGEFDPGFRFEDLSFQLRSCGALLDVEPFGERSITGMCHHIEDGTFDWTAQAVFLCVACGYTGNADVNAARNIRDTAPGHGVAVRGALQPLGGAVNREPQLIAS